MSESSAAILERARAVYQAAGASYRDALLEVGRLLHDFILARLLEGDRLTERERLAAGVCREKAVKDTAKALGLARHRVNELIATSMTVDLLLGRGKGLGAVRHATITRFACFVQRGSKVTTQAARRGEGHPSDVEAWSVKPQLEGGAQEMFARAVAEGWTQHQAAREAASLFGAVPSPQRRSVGKGSRPGGRSKEETAWPDAAGSARAGSSRDVAEMCWSLVRQAQDPPAVIAHLRQLMSTYRPEPQRLTLQGA